MPKIIGLHGLPRVGKDTLADGFVAHQGYVKLAFADEVYREVATAYEVPVEHIKSNEWKTAPQPRLALKHCDCDEFRRVAVSAGLFLDEPLSSRTVLQLWGTEFRRKLYGDDYWTSKLIGRLRQYPGKDLVIADVREDHEAIVGYWLQKHRGYDDFKIINITRPGTQSTGHSSDKGLSRFLIDAEVSNTGAADELYDLALAALVKGREEIR